MKKKISLLIIILLILSAILFLTPLAYRIGIVGPHNYEECVAAGGKTNKDQIRFADSCEYRGKTFFGGYI